HHQRTRFVQQRHHARYDGAHATITSRLYHDRTVEFDNVGAEPADAVEIGMPGAKVIDRDQAAEVAIEIDRFDQRRLVGQRGLEDLDDHPVRGKPGPFQLLLEERRRIASLDDDPGIDIEEQPGVALILAPEAAQMERTAQAIEERDPGLIANTVEDLDR